MGMRTFLAIAVNARPFVLLHVGCRTQTAITLNRQNGNVTTDVVRGQHKTSARLDFYVTRAAAQRWLLVQLSEFAGSLIHNKCRDGSALFPGKLIHLVHRIQVTAVW